MGEAWSDWYAMDYLVGQGLQEDAPAPGRHHPLPVRRRRHRPGPHRAARLQGRRPTSAACTVGPPGTRAATPTPTTATSSAAPRCTPTARSGRRPCGTCATRSAPDRRESLVTRAMELAPANPSFLDMRNAILIADNGDLRRAPTTATHLEGLRQAAAWATTPARSVATTPLPARTSTPRRPSTRTAAVTGTVTDQDTGKPVAGDHRDPGLPGRERHGQPVRRHRRRRQLHARPGAGRHLPASSTANGAGYDPATSTVTVGSRRRDEGLLAAPGLGRLERRRDASRRSTGPDYGPTCGPLQAIDNSQATGWGSTTGDDAGTPTNVFVPKNIVIDLKQPVSVSRVRGRPVRDLR